MGPEIKQSQQTGVGPGWKAYGPGQARPQAKLYPKFAYKK